MIQAPYPFEELAPGLWVTERPLRFYSLQLGTRMTVVRLNSGGLWLHSPVALDPLTLAGLQSLGPVELVICPNRLHHLFAAEYFKVFSKARIYAAPGLETKRRDLKFHGVLSQVPEPEWKGQIEQIVLYEFPVAHEVVFFHPGTRTLILTDLCFNIGGRTNLWTKLIFKLFGCHRRFGPTPDIRWMVKKNPVLQERLRKISQWDFDRILLTHGDIIETAGKKIWNEAWGPTIKLPFGTEHDPERVLRFWFGEDPSQPLKNSEAWWRKDPEFDREIQEKFENDWKAAVGGKLETWKHTPRGRLALIILLDQFSRNMFRNTPEGFSQDPWALSLCLDGMAQGQDERLAPVERCFFYMPLMHSEDRAIQDKSLAAFRRLADSAPDTLRESLLGASDYAEQHAAIIRRFGRYPHRNQILGRTNSPEEMEFLQQPGSSF